MIEKRAIGEDQVIKIGELLTLLSFIFMIAFANPFSPLPLMVSIIGFVAGLYLITLRVCPKEAKHFREFLLDKLNFIFTWSKETIKKSREKRKLKKE